MLPRIDRRLQKQSYELGYPMWPKSIITGDMSNSRFWTNLEQRKGYAVRLDDEPSAFFETLGLIPPQNEHKIMQRVPTASTASFMQALDGEPLHRDFQVRKHTSI